MVKQKKRFLFCGKKLGGDFLLSALRRLVCDAMDADLRITVIRFNPREKVIVVLAVIHKIFNARELKGITGIEVVEKLVIG